ncbi:MAG: hypothetical protein GYA60_01540 [Candidatus Methanofastidiosa archaeon]|nr:hypothetical protein [Candidatus Methanofastidiosa archaeon]
MRYYGKIILTTHFKIEAKKDHIHDIIHILKCAKETKESKKDGEVGLLEYGNIIIRYTIRQKRLILITTSRKKG